MHLSSASSVCVQVILSVRDPDKWYDSYVASLLWLYSTWWFKPFSWCLPMGWKLQASCHNYQACGCLVQH